MTAERLSASQELTDVPVELAVLLSEGEPGVFDDTIHDWLRSLLLELEEADA